MQPRSSTPSKLVSLHYEAPAPDVYGRSYDDTLAVEQSCPMISNGDTITIYDAKIGVDRDNALSA